MTTPTTNYGWIKPDIGASTDAWGGLLNTDLDGIDSTVKSVSNAAVAKAGDTMTGALNVNVTSAVSSIVVAPTAATPANVVLNKAAGQSASVYAQQAGQNRWQMAIANQTAEGGSNAGSDFQLVSFADAGALLATPLFIERKTGYATINAPGAVAQLGGAASQSAAIRLNKTASGNSSLVQGQTNGVLRWSMSLGDATAESSNAGSNFVLSAFNDAGSPATVPTPLTISRSTGVATFASSVNAGANSSVTGNFTATQGYINRSGLNGSTNAGNMFNIDFVGSASHLWIDATNQGQIAYTSDYRIKKDVAPLDSTWDRVKALNPISYTHQDFTPPVELQRDADAKPMIDADDVERWGFIAHELQETLIPSAATGEKDSPTHIQSPNPWTVIATLTRALQEAMTRIEALEAAANG